MNNDQHTQRTERNAQPNHERQQVGAIELVRRGDNANQRQYARPNTHHHGPAANFVDNRGNCKISRVQARQRAHSAPPSVFAVLIAGFTGVAPEGASPLKLGGALGTVWPEGRSAELAFWLSCNARMYAMIAQRSCAGTCAE